MQIAGYLKTSLIEWPGKISSVIFTQGCNFRCPFCHNADIVADWKRGLTLIPEDQVFADLEKRKKWVEAVAITGGEPTLQTDLTKFLTRVKQMGFLVMVETNGTKPKIITELISNKLTDYIAMDIKGDLENYSNYAKCSDAQVTAVRESMKLIVKSGIDHEFRTTVVPGLHDLKNLKKLAEQIKFLVQSSKFKVQSCHWYLQQFRPLNTLDKDYLKIKPYSKEKIEELCKKLQKIIPQTSLRGV